ncbi:MAG: winged helix-turn-helix domain-containing protein [Actinomycetota bacterium]|nr:winged helix-turn-helix domain-containing protein [Actinomycetota bacterium]
MKDEHARDIEAELRAVLEAPVRSPEDADRAAAAARALADYLRAGAAALRAMGVEPPLDPGGASSDLAQLTLDRAAEKVLAQAGVPLHVRELGRRIRDGGWRHPRKPQAGPDRIIYQLAARLPRHPDRFQRVAPNTFALTNWDLNEGPGRPRPRLATFHGTGKVTGRTIGERWEEAAGGGSWR